jgi:hypothetical protein
VALLEALGEIEIAMKVLQDMTEAATVRPRPPPPPPPHTHTHRQTECVRA